MPKANSHKVCLIVTCSVSLCNGSLKQVRTRLHLLSSVHRLIFHKSKTVKHERLAENHLKTIPKIGLNINSYITN